MTVLAGRATVIEGGDLTEVEGSRRYRIPISKAMGARDLAQTISVYSHGVAHARRNPIGEEVLYVVRGEGSCCIDGHRYALARGTAVFVPAGSAYQIDNSGEVDLEIVSVCCPEEKGTELGIGPLARGPNDTAPFLTVRESDQKPIASGDRTFKLLVNQDLGATRVTQFIGVIPPGRAPMHHHTYEEAIYVIEGEGRVWTNDGGAEFKAGSSIYLPRGVSHSLENTEAANITVLGVFHPFGKPGHALRRLAWVLCRKEASEARKTLERRERRATFDDSSNLFYFFLGDSRESAAASRFASSGIGTVPSIRIARASISLP